MSTERQQNASRVNGSKSRGATTPEGKLASSRNALKHGLSAESVRPYPRNAEAPPSASGQHGMLSTTIVLNGESTDRFLGLLATLFEEFQPQTPFEESLIENMAVARWRQMRIWGMEKAGMDHEMRRQSAMSNFPALDPPDHSSDADSSAAATRASLAFRTLSDDSRSLELINRYDSRYDRQYYRAHRRFIETRDRRTPPSAPTPQPAPVPAMPTPPPVPQAGVPQAVPEKAQFPNEPETVAPQKVHLSNRTRQLTVNRTRFSKHRSYNRDYARAYERVRPQRLGAAASRVLRPRAQTLYNCFPAGLRTGARPSCGWQMTRWKMDKNA
jgi:hypothetical protein